MAPRHMSEVLEQVTETPGSRVSASRKLGNTYYDYVFLDPQVLSSRVSMQKSFYI